MISINKSKYTLFLIPFILFFTALFWLILGIEDNCLALDEPFSVFEAGKSISEIITDLNKGNNPPLYEIILHYWILFFGNGIFSVRFLSVIAGALLPVVWYHVVKLKTDYRFGLLVFALILFSNSNTSYSHEARVYAIWALFTGISFYAAEKWIQNKSRNTCIILFVLSASLLLYLHYLSVFVLLSLFIYLIFSQIKLKKIILPFVVILILDLPILLNLSIRLSSGAALELWTQPPSPKHFYGNLNPFLNHPFTSYLLYTISFAYIIILFISKDKTYHRLYRTILPVFMAFIIPYSVQFILSYKVPIFIPRYVFVYQGIFAYLLVQFISVVLSNNKKHIYLFYPVLALFIGYSDISVDNGRRPDRVVSIAETFNKEYTGRGIVVISPEWYKLEFSYYFVPNAFTNNFLNQALEERSVYPIWDPDNLHQLILQHKPTYILYIDGGTEFSFGKDFVSEYLSGISSRLLETEVDNAVIITLYRLNPE
jgi:4-amino-4-deoxy-L-arabinose transferase-like glycosyltransferase